MTGNAKFLSTCIGLLILAWLFSGERLLDAAFDMPDMGPLDDAVIAGMVALEDLKSRLGLPDAFGALRHLLHSAFGV